MGLRAVHRVFLIVCAGVVLAAMVAVMPATATAGGLELPHFGGQVDYAA